MWATIKKLSLYVGMLAGFVLTVQAFQGTFKTVWFGKVVRISKSSKNFLATIVPLQQKLFTSLIEYKQISPDNQKHMRLLLKMSNCWIHDDNMCGSDIEQFGDLLAIARQSGAVRSSVTVDYQKMIVNSKVVHAIASLLLDQLQHVHLGTEIANLKLISQFLMQLREHAIYDTEQQLALIRTQGIVLDIMHHFDGLAVTEYDFMVLSQCALFLQLVRFCVMS